VTAEAMESVGGMEDRLEEIAGRFVDFLASADGEPEDMRVMWEADDIAYLIEVGRTCRDLVAAVGEALEAAKVDGAP
jgi:hypothetical protein